MNPSRPKSQSFYVHQGQNLLLNLWVQTNATQEALVCISQGKLKVRLRAKAINGEANAKLMGFVSTLFKVARSQVTIMSGERSQFKRLCIQNPQVWPVALDELEQL